MAISNEELHDVILQTVGEADAMAMLKRMFSERTTFADLVEAERVTFVGALHAAKLAKKSRRQRDSGKIADEERKIDDAGKSYPDDWYE